MQRSTPPRGYALLIVMVAGIVLAALSVAMLTAAGADRRGNRIQMNSVKALYAAESAVAFAVDELGNRLEGSVDPSFTGIGAPNLPGATYPKFDISYVNPNNGYTSTKDEGSCTDDTDCTGGVAGSCSANGYCRFSSVATLTAGDYAGLTALQTPIQVLVTASVGSSLASIGDVVKLNLIPIFQFGLFFDGDLEFYTPPTMTISGRVHTNGNFHPIRPGGSSLTFDDAITVAGYQHRCAIHNTGSCFSPGNSNVVVDGDILDEGREDHPSDIDQAAYHGQSKFNGQIKDRASGVVRLNPPIPLSVTRPDVVSRPDTCGNKTSAGSASFEQGVGIHIIRRPNALVSTTNYPNMAASDRAYTEKYGPSPASTIVGAWSGDAPFTNCSAASHGAHCQNLNAKVPVVIHSQAADDQAVAGERMYWKAHIRIIDGIWYDSDNNVIFNPETWNLNVGAATGAAAALSDHVKRGYAFARVLRYGWFWDARENRVYDSSIDGSFASTMYHRGLQMRTTDVDLFAFHQLLQDPGAVSAIFGAGGVPTGGIILYVSETFDPWFEDRNTTTERKTNVRNFLNFHSLDGTDTATDAEACLEYAQSVPNPAADDYPPCALGWHPYYLWGPGATAMLGGDDWAESIVRGGADDPDQGIMETPAPASNLGFTASPNCYNPIDRDSPVYDPTDPLPPCQLPVARPVGPENAVRLIRAQHLPRISGDPPEGLTIASDNRFYLYGDVNVKSNGDQELPGRVAFIVDSISLMSQAFSDFIMQRGAMNNDSYWLTPSLYSTFGQQAAAPMPHVTAPAFDGDGAGALPPYAFGDAPNLCNAWNDYGGESRRKGVELRINASLMMGDVPACEDSFVKDGDGSTSGGVNNFPRFVENLDGRAVRIKGSIVSLFRSEQGNARWLAHHGNNSANEDQWAPTVASTPTASSYDNDQNRGCVYSAPYRYWGFDTALSNPDNLPPGTPRLVNVSRVRWVRR